MRRTAAVTLVSIAAAGLLAWVMFRPAPEAEHQPMVADAPSDLPPLAETPFLNTSASATYVGVESCAACHPAELESYAQTAHHFALSDVDLVTEPPDGAFVDELSGRRYEIERRDDRLWHRELLLNDAGDDLLLVELPMRYGIGSGRFSRSYLAERDGFLVESPATWYAARPGWAVSPGYERRNPGFERPITRECLGCHVGRAEVDDGTMQKFTIHSQAVDCERCHSAGSLHEEHWSGTAAPDDDAVQDLTIVNPGRLSRNDAEAICAQCHLHPAATVELRGRRLSDFRPGMRLEDFCVHYGLKTPGADMKVVGHMEQMRLSPCYLGSETLTCTTCHDPHTETPRELRQAEYRAKCIACHAEDACGLTVAERTAKVADDDCMTCHMPKSPTDIPHFAFTHHRIGIHREEKASSIPRASELVPLEDVSQLPEIEQDRCLGLAYVQVASTGAETAEISQGYLRRGQKLLESVKQRGLHDPEVDAALARLNWRTDPAKTIALAQAVLDDEQATPESRVTALFTLGSTLADQGEAERAIPILEALVAARLYSEDWYILSRCYEGVGDLAKALTAAERAAEISPQYPELQMHLAKLHDMDGDAEQAAEHRRRAEQLGKAQGLQMQPAGR